ncbi:MAG TPA: FAD:protein FMN transferase [Jatrophihabitantaceae bacterium]
MSSPTALPAADMVASFESMASVVKVRLRGATPGADGLVGAVRAVFVEVETQCTRFDPTSALMRANAAGDVWCPVPARCYEAIREAAHAYRATAGRFDPRVLRALQTMGYDRSLPFARGVAVRGGRAEGIGAPWHPEFDDRNSAVRVGSEPIDLGGIGKGLALRWAAERVVAECAAFLIEAGGDCYLAGDGPSGDGWQVGVEHPDGGPDSVAVLTIRDAACATSSIRLRNWVAGGRRVHHLVDPRTGAPGGAGLRSVTVVGPDPAMAEVWSKVLFLAGREGIAEAAAGRQALWVADDGSVGMSPLMTPMVIWLAGA